jgi:hypothetical protein
MGGCGAGHCGFFRVVKKPRTGYFREILRARTIMRTPVDTYRTPMTVPQDSFRRFQEELAALDRKNEQRALEKSSGDTPLARAKSEFHALRERYALTVADVVAFFPEEEGIEYLRQIIAETESRPRRTRKL